MIYTRITPSTKKAANPQKFNKYEMFDLVVFEAIILSLAIRQVSNGELLEPEDQLRVLKAEETINDIARECRS